MLGMQDAAPSQPSQPLDTNRLRYAIVPSQPRFRWAPESPPAQRMLQTFCDLRREDSIYEEWDKDLAATATMLCKLCVIPS